MILVNLVPTFPGCAAAPHVTKKHGAADLCWGAMSSRSTPCQSWSQEGRIRSKRWRSKLPSPPRGRRASNKQGSVCGTQITGIKSDAANVITLQIRSMRGLHGDNCVSNDVFFRWQKADHGGESSGCWLLCVCLKLSHNEKLVIQTAESNSGVQYKWFQGAVSGVSCH